MKILQTKLPKENLKWFVTRWKQMACTFYDKQKLPTQAAEGPGFCKMSAN